MTHDGYTEPWTQTHDQEAPTHGHIPLGNL